MTFPDLVPDLRARMPELRGRLIANQPLAELTWFRVGGPAQVLFSPQDEADLAYFLARLPAEVPVTVVGLGSNLIVRDGGVAGIVIRLGRGFSDIVVESGERVRAGTAVPDVKVARAAQEASIAGLSFLRGIPGSIGGALRMNGGAYGGETKDVLVEARGVDRSGASSPSAMPTCTTPTAIAARPRTSSSPTALFQGRPGDPAVIAAEMDKITESREATQPIKSRTGGSTFKNPPGHKAWQLIDAAGCRGLVVGGAQVSTMHCNFLINLGSATAADIEELGRNRAGSRQGQFRRRARLGDQADRRRGLTCLRVRPAGTGERKSRIASGRADALRESGDEPMTTKHVAVLMGGWSAEREVSLRSGAACAGALERRGYRVTRVDVGRDIATVLANLKPDVALNVLHGRPGEDGTMQGILEILQIPYSHSGRARLGAGDAEGRRQGRHGQCRGAGPRRHGGVAPGRREGASVAAALRHQADRRGVERRRLHRHRGP